MAATQLGATREEIKDETDAPELSRLEKFRKKVTPNRHTKIENFGRRIVVSGAAFGLMLTTAGVLTYQHSQVQLSERAQYSTKFQTSKTNQGGTVDGVYTSKDRSRVLVMMTFADPARMSAQAANYRAFLAGSGVDQKTGKIKTKPSGSIIMFGQGHMGLYLTHAGGFKEQIVSAIIRADKQLVSTTDAGSSDEVDPRQSFQKYDQWEMYFNPAGHDAIHIPSLDASELNMGQIFYDTVAKKQEVDLKNDLNTDLVALKADLASIQDYRTRLLTTTINGLRVKVPDDPEMVKGDEVTGNDKTPTSPSTLMLKPKTVFNNGFNFDWRTKSIEKGIIQDLTPKGQNYVTWFNTHMAQPAQDDPSMSLAWKLSDGTDLSSVSTSDVVAFQNLNASVQSLVTAYSTYYTDKEKYQSQDLGKLLSLDMQLKDVVQNNNINTGPKVINFYG